MNKLREYIPRRSFITGLTALLAAPAVCRVDSLMRLGQPVLWGDGVHDDWAAVMWRINRAAPGGMVRLPAGRFLISRVIDVAKPIHLRGSGHGEQMTTFAFGDHWPQGVYSETRY